MSLKYKTRKSGKAILTQLDVFFMSSSTQVLDAAYISDNYGNINKLCKGFPVGSDRHIDEVLFDPEEKNTIVTVYTNKGNHFTGFYLVSVEN